MTLPVHRGAGPPAGHWVPGEFSDLADLAGQMGELFQRALGQSERWSLPVDLEETDGAYLLEADLPGVRREDIDLSLHGRELVVHGTVVERERTGRVRHQSRHTGQFDYTITLPGEVDAERCEASLDNGVLTVRAPKADTNRRHRIDVSSG